MERQAAGSALPVFSVIRRCGKNPLASAAVRAVRNQLFTVSGSISRVTGHGVNGNNGNGAFTAACNLIDISRAFR